jgi:methyltransferase family protein
MENTTMHPADAERVPSSARPVADEQLWPLRERYGNSFPLPALSYGTVRDLADSTDQMPGLANAGFDMKNLQRCWTVKAILGNVKAGGEVLEIGAGEPLVADLLSRLGYRVTVVDPYDGSGNGPREYTTFRRAYPDVSFIHDSFPPARELPAKFDAIYSISVLEHVPLDRIESVIGQAEHLLMPTGGCSIHAIDHVIAGWGAEEHRAKLERIVGALGLDSGLLADALTSLERDPEAYFVSAEAHDRWRGDLSYDLYPMRRIASIQLLQR